MFDLHHLPMNLAAKFSWKDEIKAKYDPNLLPRREGP